MFVTGGCLSGSEFYVRVGRISRAEAVEVLGRRGSGFAVLVI